MKVEGAPILSRGVNKVCNQRNCQKNVSSYDHNNCHEHPDCHDEYIYHLKNQQIQELMKTCKNGWVRKYIHYSICLQKNETRIPCPECNCWIWNENICNCEDDTDCCIDHHDYFFCPNCEEQKDVNWKDQI